MSNLSRLKNADEEINEIRITEDLTISEREVTKSMVESDKHENECDAKFFHKVIGSARRGSLRIIKVERKNTSAKEQEPDENEEDKMKLMPSQKELMERNKKKYSVM